MIVFLRILSLGVAVERDQGLVPTRFLPVKISTRSLSIVRVFLDNHHGEIRQEVTSSNDKRSYTIFIAAVPLYSPCFIESYQGMH